MLDFAKDAAAPADPFAPPTPRPSTPNALADADLCLSLESLRGRKYLPVRSIIPLADEELDSDDSVQLSVESPLLASFFASSLCSAPKLTPGGRTALAIEVGLGDEGLEASTIVIYGQRQADSGLRLCVGRRAVAPSPRKVRPGEPLPRAPLFLPTKAARKPRPPLARATSSVYAPPPAALAASTSTSSAVPDGRTPGRRGEKRPRKDAATGNEDDKRRRAGRIVKPVPDKDADEDIFGRRSASLAPTRAASVAPSASVALESDADPPRPAQRRMPQQTLDNKAMVRKQALVALEARGVLRDHGLFKDVFSLVTKGTYFAVVSWTPRVWWMAAHALRSDERSIPPRWIKPLCRILFGGTWICTSTQRWRLMTARRRIRTRVAEQLSQHVMYHCIERRGDAALTAH